MKLDLVDVFGSAPMRGNPLGVVHDAEALDDAQMLALTRWLGFSETTFLLPPTEPGADYRVRIFYPGGELPFAGHPTLGTCHAWLEAGGEPQREGLVVQQCGAGLVEIKREGEGLAFAAPPMVKTGLLEASELAEAARVAGVPAERVVEGVHAHNGPAWQLLRLQSAADVLAAKPLPVAPAGSLVGLAGPYESGAELAWEVRAFFVNEAGVVVEDPVTGSLNAGIAMHLFDTGLAQGGYVAGQGQRIGADGRAYCSIDAGGVVWVGGRVATVARGAELPVFA